MRVGNRLPSHGIDNLLDGLGPVEAEAFLEHFQSTGREWRISITAGRHHAAGEQEQALSGFHAYGLSLEAGVLADAERIAAGTYTPVATR